MALPQKKIIEEEKTVGLIEHAKARGHMNKGRSSQISFGCGLQPALSASTRAARCRMRD